MSIIINPYAFGTPAGVTYATWNPSDKATDVTLISGNLSAYNGSGSDGNDLVRATQTVSIKSYFEVSTLQDRSAPPGDGMIVGLVTGAATLAGGQVGGSGSDYGIGIAYRRYVGAGNGAHYWLNGSSASVGIDPVLASGWCGIAYDPALGMWVCIDGTWVSGKSPLSHPSSPAFTITGTRYPAVSSYYRQATYADCIHTANFGATAFNIGSVFGVGGVLEGFRAGVYT